MQADDLRSWLDALEFGGDLCLLSSKGSELRFALRCAERLVDHQVQDAVYLALHRSLPGFRLRASLDRAGGEALPFRIVGVDVDGDRLTIRQALSQPVRHGRLDHVEIEGPAVLAGARLARHGALDADAAGGRVLDRHAAFAASAFQKAGEQPLRAPVRGWVGHGIFLLQPQRDCGQVLVDQAQARRVGCLPFAFWVHARHAPPGLRVFHHADAVPDDHASVDRVQDDAVPALGVAVDRRGGPCGAARRGDPVPVQPDRDLARFPSGRILAKDPPHDVGLSLFDLHHARRPELRSIAIGAAASMSPVVHDAGHAAADLVSEILQEQRADEAADADLDMVGLAVVYGPELDACEGQALVDAGKVLLIAREPVQGFDDDDVELPLARLVHERQEAVSAHDGRGRARPVFMERHDLMACLRCIGAAESDLILDRAVFLQIARKSGVDRGARHGFSPAVSRA